MNYDIFSSVENFNITINDTNESIINNNTRSLVSSFYKTVFFNNLIIKTMSLKILGCQGLRNLPNATVLSSGFISLRIRPAGLVYNTSTSAFEQPNINIINKDFLLSPLEYDYNHDLGILVTPFYNWNNTVYISEQNVFDLEFVTTAQGTPTLTYDSLGINPIYINRVCNIKVSFSIEN